MALLFFADCSTASAMSIEEIENLRRTAERLMILCRAFQRGHPRADEVCACAADKVVTWTLREGIAELAAGSPFTAREHERHAIAVSLCIRPGGIFPMPPGPR
jgi:hypothetical protein